MTESKEQQYETLYGPLYPYSDHKIGETITYRNEGTQYTGVIVWVCAPQREGRQRIPASYIVERTSAGDSWPDTVYPGEIIIH